MLSNSNKNQEYFVIHRSAFWQETFVLALEPFALKEHPHSRECDVLRAYDQANIGAIFLRPTRTAAFLPNATPTHVARGAE